ncbi:MAG: CRISPR-associated helicase Cas3' [Bacteroidetes bacterium]|nr:CRISPR-associated helicase Cas3' [Bacteroidota bacterium]
MKSDGPAEIFAHSENEKGERHELKAHLLQTAELAQSFSPADDFQGLFYLAGLLHDVGKFQDGFQKYLFEGGKRTPHAGVRALVAKVLAREYLPLQFVIQGHHAGMPDNSGRNANIEDYGDNQDVVNILCERFKEVFPALAVPKIVLPKKDLVLAECITRFLFSALTDADWLDTEHHFQTERTEARMCQRLDRDGLCELLLEKLENKFQQLPTEGRINALRTKARVDAATHAEENPGFFSLQLPTGLGKTLTSMYWALLHARHNHLQRIVIVLPYINIIDQTARILKEVFGEDAVLEHHSGIVDEDGTKDKYDEGDVGDDGELAKRLACENWDAPIIVTTSVQFFESLFSNRPFKCRKNHNIAESVVIFDEVQTLPKEYAEPIIVMLKNVSALARTSFLFCTATQPAFMKREGFDGIENMRPLITKPEKYFKPTRRVNYELLNGLEAVPLDRVVKELNREMGSFLAIVNTKSVARELFRQVKRFSGFDKSYHLSTAMCPHHRKKTINAIVEDLNNKKLIAVVSTQLVEAGVDFDFPCVYRAIAPMDSVIQAAGRCNRNGTLHRGKVVLFNLEKHSMPDKTYEACSRFAMGIIKDDVDVLHDARSFEEYYEQVTRLFVNADKRKITEKRERFDFREVCESFKFIDEPTTSLVIEQYAEGKSLLDEIKKLIDAEDISQRRIVTRQHYRKLQQFSVQVYPNFIRDFNGQIITPNDTIKIYTGNYDKDFGLSPKDVETVF